MFCPICKSEYREGIRECANCKTKLVEKLPKEDEFEYREIVTVFASTEPGIIAVVKSILEGEGIWYFAKGESIQKFFSVGRMGYNTITGPVEIQVSVNDEEAAREILQELY